MDSNFREVEPQADLRIVYVFGTDAGKGVASSGGICHECTKLNTAHPLIRDSRSTSRVHTLQPADISVVRVQG